MKKRILDRRRIRSIQGGFAFIPHRFLTDGFLSSLEPSQLLVYLFLILVSDAKGLSFYSNNSICRLLGIPRQVLTAARDALIDRDLIVYRTPLYQVLELPKTAKQTWTESPCPSTSSASSFSDLHRLLED